MTMTPTTRRRWTEDEDGVIRREYQAEGAAAVAARLGRSVRSVHHRAKALRVAVPNIRPDWSEVRSLYDRGLTDPEIGHECGVDRHRISAWRRSEGLPSNRGHPRHRRRVSSATRRQLEPLGLRSVAELRSAVFRLRSIEAGWPADLGPRHIAILDALADRGPMTRRQICEAIGARWIGSRRSLKSRGRGGSYLAQLIRRGLVVSLGRVGTVTGEGKGRSCQVYSLALATERKSP